MATYALIPGAGGDARYWRLVATRLTGRGHEAIPISLPAGDDAAGWTEYGDAVVDAVGTREHVVLVAQSLAGFTAPLACMRLSVDLMVLLNAMIPRPGETGSDWWTNTGQGPAMRDHLGSIGLSPEASDDDEAIYFHDVPPDVVAETFGGAEPEQSWTPMEQPWPLEAWPPVPTRVLAGRDDRLFPAGFQRLVARERLGIDADEIDGGHLLALSRPAELVDRLEAYRLATSEAGP